jgi:para-nitrobenzyl esterase
MKTWFATLAALALGAAPAAAAPVKAKIDAGALVGSSENGVNVFKGIPFAQPPVGPLRWAPPAMPAKWTGERDATKFQLPCPQPINADGRPNGGGVSGATSEDCLYLNVWAPADAKNAPIMVWLYGGAGYLGAGHLGAYNGTSFAKNGVIIVTINYRLGALGAFAHPALTKAAGPKTPLVSYALMDAVAALQWVKRNAASFGGDPNNVTLFGQSAGGAMTTALLSVPAAKGLYHKAIIQSGASLRGGITLAEGEAQGAKAATALGLPGADATLEQLRAVPADKLVATADVRQGIRGVIDGRFVTTTTRDALNNGTAFDVPLIVGSNNGEGGGDAAQQMVKLAAGGAPSYRYLFNYVPEWRKTAQANGAPHSAELPYSFASLTTAASSTSQVNEADRAVARRMNSCWVAFAKARPGTRDLACADGFTWPAYTPERDDAAVFGADPSLRKASTIPNGPPPAPQRTAVN